MSTVHRAVAERFVPIELAGRGGMGVVYRAEDRESGSPVALKLMDGEDEIDRARFEREARVLKSIDHPNVVRYIAHGTTDGDVPFLAMSWLEGESLAARLRRGPIAADEAVRLCAQAAAGLGAAHANGIVHRDVKPSNLFITNADPPAIEVIDFGIARAIATGQTLTKTGLVLGTPFYMAPEQARHGARVDARADVYALGAVLYHALGGTPPFSSPNLMAVLAAILLENPVHILERVPDVPAAIAELTMELLEKSPDRRPADGDALRDRLARVGSMPPGAVRSMPPPALTEREQRVICLVLAVGDFAVGASDATLAGDTPDVLGQARAAAEAHGGRVEVLRDGSLLARVDAFGTPADQAVRAARCARALRTVLPSAPMAAVAGRGELAGPVPVGEVVERGSALLGPASETLTAGSLGGPREPVPGGHVQIDDVMAGLLGGRFEVHRRAGSLWLGDEARDGTTSRERQGAFELVGRRRELANLRALYHECVEEPLARAAIIVGRAGIGKTRLVTELVGRLTDAPQPPWVWTAECDARSANAPLHLIGQLVRSAATICAGEPLPDRRDKLARCVERAVRGAMQPATFAALADLARVPVAAAAEGAGPASIRPPDDPKLRGDAMRGAFLDWLADAIRARPILIVIDDLQWADAASIALLDTAMRELVDAPMMIVATARPELRDVHGDPWAARDAQPIRLGRLRPKAALVIVERAIGDADPALAAKIIGRADGNPFFLIELIGAVLRGGEEHGLPTTVLGMVEARLAELEAETRRILRAASVFGRRFWPGAVAELVGEPRGSADVARRLDALIELELIARAPSSRFASAGEPELVFVSELTQRAAFAMLTADDAKLGHKLAAAWLERAGEDDATVLADHLHRAGEAQSAALWFGRAADQALRGDDLETAIELASRSVTTRPSADVSLTLAEALRWRGDYESALERAVSAARAQERGTRPWFRALGIVFSAGGQLGADETVQEHRELALAATARDDAVGAQVVALCRAATIALAKDDRVSLEETMERAEALARGREGEPLARAWILTLRASEAFRAGDIGAFVDGTERAVASYEAAHDLRDACNQRVRLGNAYVALGDAGSGERVLRAALASARRMGLLLVEGYARQNLAHAQLRRGDLDGARANLDMSIALSRELGDRVLEAGSLLYRSELRVIGAADLPGAIADAERAVELLDDVPAFLTVAHAVLARALLATGDRADAERGIACAESAKEGLRQRSIEEGEALVRLVHIEAMIRARREADATAAKERARARLDELASRISDPRWREGFLERVPRTAGSASSRKPSHEAVGRGPRDRRRGVGKRDDVEERAGAERLARARTAERGDDRRRGSARR